MKKNIFILAVAVLVLGMTGLTFAQTAAVVAKNVEVKTYAVKGKIVTIDTKQNEIVIKENKTDLEKTIIADANIIASFKVGDEVKATLKEGSNVAISVKKHVRKVEPKQK